MAYTNAISPNRRIATIVAVGSIQLGIGLALINGLAVKWMPRIDSTVTGIPIPKEEDPPPPPPRDRPIDKPLTQTPAPPKPLPPNPFDGLTKPTGPLIEDLGGGGIGDGGIGEVSFPPPPPSPSPSFAPKSARPRGNPASWVTTDDYPSRGLHDELQGVVRVRLDVGIDGKVSDCTVTASSGEAILDAAACAKLKARGRFDPATDGSGAKVPGTWSTSVRWTLPD